MGWFFFFFFISGFCSILYEIIWLRLAMAQFGVTSALVSIVLSVFMAGLGLGSWGSGRWIGSHADKLRVPPLCLYALIESAIGLSAILVPQELLWGRRFLEYLGLSSSATYYLGSGFWVAFTLVPWCACMGATIPVAMLAIKKRFQEKAERSFSYLYLANILGAGFGAVLPLFLIEIYGFHGTLKAGAVLNGFLAVSAAALTLRLSTAKQEPASSEPASAPAFSHASTANRKLLALLFTTGLTSMGMEVVWIRQFTPYLGTVVYAFALILCLYLGSTFLGSRFYRWWGIYYKTEEAFLWALLGFSALLPLIAADPRYHSVPLLRPLAIVPFSGILGFLTPMLVDRWSGGDPGKAGSAYAVNVVGCIVGPLIAGFLLLPLMNERWVLFTLSLPWLVTGILPHWFFGLEKTSSRPGVWRKASYAAVLLPVVLMLVSQDFEGQFPRAEILRDHTATIIATGEGMHKRLLVNGVGITALTPITKMMAHLPLAFLEHPPEDALVVCFGMGTTYRSLLSWGIPTTAVELVPSVPRVFWYFHSDAPELLRSPLSHVVIDDGRRFLERTREQYDVITVDPPPPVQAAGSSLLYSKEFYSSIKQRLRSGGILQQWLPYGDATLRAAVARALKESFLYVRLFQYGPKGGFHFLASNHPLRNWTAGELARKMPPAAARDLMEWSAGPTVEGEFDAILQKEGSLDRMLAGDPEAPALQDDRPINEYFILRQLGKLK